MTNAEMHSIQVQDTPVFLKRALAPGFKLLGERLVEATNRTGTLCHSQERLGHFPHFVCAYSCDKHLGESLPPPGVHSGCSDRRPACGTDLPDLGGLATPRSDPWRSPGRGYRNRCDTLCAWGYT